MVTQKWHLLFVDAVSLHRIQPPLLLPARQIRGMKRKAAQSPEPSTSKVARVEDYCNAKPKIDPNGNTIWPAPESQLTAAQTFLKYWYGCIVSRFIPHSDGIAVQLRKSQLLSSLTRMPMDFLLESLSIGR